ncbi:hypothetical protein [Thermoanaerobacter mathranii]|uniref:hypothetical protein n=1 Tax=Thermoanaerobacter mathranii TaxID=583357 RepID=UPI003D6B262C
MKVYELKDRKRTVKVFIGENGHIGFEKPWEEIEAELVLEKLTNNDSNQSLETQISKFLKNTHKDDKNFLKKIKNKSEELYKFFTKIAQKREKRLSEKLLSNLSNSGEFIQKQIMHRIQNKVKKVINEQTIYRRSESRWVDPENEISISFTADEANIQQTSWPIWSSNGKWKGNDTLLSVELPYRWYNKIYIKGFAIVDGWLVLDIIEKINEDNCKVIAGKQGRGFELYPAPAVITRKNGQWALKWIKKSKKGE